LFFQIFFPARYTGAIFDRGILSPGPLLRAAGKNGGTTIMDGLRLGIDIGSTTSKVVLAGPGGSVLFSDYARHHTRTRETLVAQLERIGEAHGDVPVRAACSGSGAMGLAESAGVPFVQEIIAAAALAAARHPAAGSLVDIGGEDSKLILFEAGRAPDIRMNGNCAGGTGAFIDQMALLLDRTIGELDELALGASAVYPIASRCGVFARTDVQNLLSRKIDPADIARSIFEAVAGQIINSLARGRTIRPPVVFTGGPLTWIRSLRRAFARLLALGEADIVLPTHGELFTALGAAHSAADDAPFRTLSELTLRVRHARAAPAATLPPLFRDRAERERWERDRRRVPLDEAPAGGECRLGIDSGSTTTKIVAVDAAGAVLFGFYRNNQGRPLETVLEGLGEFARQTAGAPVRVAAAAVTGYGEELVRAALGIELGVVETVAHYLAAQRIAPGVSFILDVGGQDMKAVFVRDGILGNIEINEACSSGCGSFLENFAGALGYDPPEFARLATGSTAPCDLGSRCTVFMNSRVRQAVGDGATISDLGAGLAYSVVKNCLHKVLRIRSWDDIGDTVVVQGGVFRNDAVVRSLELLSGKTVLVSDRPELMGAYGAALYALERGGESSFIGLGRLGEAREYTTRITSCHGCPNRCRVTVYRFAHGGVCHSGNKCEKVFGGGGAASSRGANIYDRKRELLFGPSSEGPVAEGPPGPPGPPGRLRIGLPRVLDMYEHYPFWRALLEGCGFEVVPSDESSQALYERGIGALMSDNICLPAKLAHGHVVNLVDKGVDRILLPYVVYAEKAFERSANSFNCPIVTAYAEVLRSARLPDASAAVPFDSPPVAFHDPLLLEKACRRYLRSLGVGAALFRRAFGRALRAQGEFRRALAEANDAILWEARRRGETVVLVAGHPYHADRMVHQQVSQILADMGVHVINEDIATGSEGEGFGEFLAVSQWEYPSRILQSAWWASRQPFPIGFIQLNSFGCGPDSFIMDEVRDLARRTHLPFALVRVDEISSPGSVRLRLRSLVESLKLKERGPAVPAVAPAPPGRAVGERTILAPWFSDFYSPFIPLIGKCAGYRIENLPPPDARSAELGLQYVNNEVCYPAILVVGDIIRALRGGRYDPAEVAVGITQTGGQCRASNYIALIRRALADAGFGGVPVLSLAVSKAVGSRRSGFRPDWLRAVRPAFSAVLYADALSRLYHATAPRERVAGEAARLRDRYIGLGCASWDDGGPGRLPDLLRAAVADFNAVATAVDEVRTVGVVGEIYVKYNSFGQAGILDWLIARRVEPVLPPLVEFFTQAFVNAGVRRDDFLQRRRPLDFLAPFLERAAQRAAGCFEEAMRGFRFRRPVEGIRGAARLAAEALSLDNQYGEGWLIPAGIASCARQGIRHVVCLQPFGCIANHVVGKGMEMRMKSLYPDMNLLYLDFDSGVSRVNVLNRLHFLIQNIPPGDGGTFAAGGAYNGCTHTQERGEP
jgi:predicted CoA-substrate-specific enzyme activase